MIFNVAQLLKAPIGSSETVSLDDRDHLDLNETGLRLAGPVMGQVKLHHTNQGIYADGTARVPLSLTCDRCLEAFTTTVTFPLHEDYYPTIDVNTGLPVADPGRELAFPIDRHHHVDMREAIRQNLLLAMPARALCREACAGLCPTCGADLNEGPCGCQPEQEDSRFAALRDLLDGAS